MHTANVIGTTCSYSGILSNTNILNPGINGYCRTQHAFPSSYSAVCFSVTSMQPFPICWRIYLHCTSKLRPGRQGDDGDPAAADKQPLLQRREGVALAHPRSSNPRAQNLRGPKHSAAQNSRTQNFRGFQLPRSCGFRGFYGRKLLDLG